MLKSPSISTRPLLKPETEIGTKADFEIKSYLFWPFSGIFGTNLVTESGNADIPNISTRPLLKPETEFVTEKDFEIKSGEDIDVIDTVADETSTADYEYYYVYYDEEGNMVIFFRIYRQS